MCYMWVFKVNSRFPGSLMLDVLDAGSQRAQQVFWFPEVECVRCRFQRAQEVFWFLRFDVLDVGIQRAHQDS